MLAFKVVVVARVPVEVLVLDGVLVAVQEAVQEIVRKGVQILVAGRVWVVAASHV